MLFVWSLFIFKLRFNEGNYLVTLWDAESSGCEVKAVGINECILQADGIKWVHYVMQRRKLEVVVVVAGVVEEAVVAAAVEVVVEVVVEAAVGAAAATVVEVAAAVAVAAEVQTFVEAAEVQTFVEPVEVQTFVEPVEVQTFVEAAEIALEAATVAEIVSVTITWNYCIILPLHSWNNFTFTVNKTKEIINE